MRINPESARNRVVGRVRSRLGWAGLFLALAGATAGMDDVVAGPLDARASLCIANTSGGRGPSNTMYERFSLPIFSLNNASTISVPGQAAVGQVLYAVEKALPSLSGGAQGQAAAMYGCPPGAMERFIGNMAYGTVPGRPDIYRTSVPGIGYRVFYLTNASNNVVAPVTYTNPYTSGVLVFPFDSPSWTPGAHTRIEIVGTGDPIGTGTILGSLVYGEVIVTGPGTGTRPPDITYLVRLNNNLRISLATCAVSNTVGLNMTLPDASISDLKNDAANDISHTDLTVACTATSSSAPTLSITGTTVGGYPATLVNQETGVDGAKGVGLSLWVRDPATGNFRQPTMGVAQVNLGTPLSTLPTPVWSYRIGASYKRINAQPKSGKVKGTATLTFTYS